MLPSSVEHLFDGPLEVLLLNLLSGERISETEVLAAVEVLQATASIVIGDAEEVIDLECDAGQLWPGGHRSADQGRLAEGGGAAGQQLNVAGRLVEVVGILQIGTGARVALQKGVPDVLGALLAARLAVAEGRLDAAQIGRPVIVVQSQVGEVGEEGGEGGHLIGTGSGGERKVMSVDYCSH